MVVLLGFCEKAAANEERRREMFVCDKIEGEII